ncbi:hypothetical protein [Burkholderia pseudomallei]|uniref:hypothetical protein n=1 Tax=Burkholderia pseudomallei TaxID=28450 RepID=UPI0012B2A49C|nr:hypothetical protein [Burkholderia pseudomallei]
MTTRTKEEERLMSQIANLEAELNRKRELLREERERNCGVRIGDIVLYRGEEYRVAEIDPQPYGGAWVRGNPKKKNGEFGNQIRALYNRWTHTSRRAPASEGEQK